MTTTPTVINTFTEKDPAELLRVGIDFKSALQQNEAITGCLWTASAYVGSDPTPSAILSGPATFIGTVVYTRIQGGLAGRTYKLKATCPTTAGRTLVGVGFLPVG